MLKPDAPIRINYPRILESIKYDLAGNLEDVLLYLESFKNKYKNLNLYITVEDYEHDNCDIYLMTKDEESLENFEKRQKLYKAKLETYKQWKIKNDERRKLQTEKGEKALYLKLKKKFDV